jgi:hypothetical protein
MPTRLLRSTIIPGAYAICRLALKREVSAQTQEPSANHFSHYDIIPVRYFEFIRSVTCLTRLREIPRF